MNSLPDDTLAGLQARFAAALRGDPADDSATRAMSSCIVDDGLAPERRLRIYRNNVRTAFEGALSRTYPVLKQEIGGEAFERLARQYRAAHPSCSGDLHWVGMAFPDWLASRQSATDGGRFVDIARLEWSCEEALVAPLRGALDRAALAGVPAAKLADTRLALQPGLRVVSSPHPVWSLWRAHQPEHADQPPNDADGEQHVIVACTRERLTLRSVPREQAEFIRALARGITLGDAIDASNMPLEELPDVLGWLFDDELVVSLLSSTGSSPAQEA